MGLGLFVLAGVPAAADPITVSSASAAAMVVSLIGGNPGIDVIPGSETFVGASGAAGLFSGGTGILPFDAGVTLTTGSADRVPFAPGPSNPNQCPSVGVPGPNDCGEASLDNGLPGDVDLTLISGLPTFDASVLSFDFVPAGDTVSFQYAFGSEEYNEFVGLSFSDVFAFLLDGQNIATIAGGSVSIDNVNQFENSEYFLDNSGGALNIQYDGLVGVGLGFPLFATAAVIPGERYTIKLAIADAGDGIYDSGVMLAAGTFATNVPPEPPPIPEPGTLFLVGSGLAAVAQRARRRRRQRGTSQ